MATLPHRRVFTPVHLHHLYLDVVEGSEARGGLDGARDCTRRESVDRVHFPLALLEPPRDPLERGETYCRTVVFVARAHIIHAQEVRRDNSRIGGRGEGRRGGRQCISDTVPR